MLMLAFAQSPQPRLADAVPVSVLRSPPHAEALLGAGKTEQRTLLAGSTCALAVAAQCRARVKCKSRKTFKVVCRDQALPQSDNDVGLFTSGAVFDQPPKAKSDVQPAMQHPSGKRLKVIVLGSGGGAASFLNALSQQEAQMYDITVVSMRNFFLYTPLLPTCTMGSIEERSIVTPIREMAYGKADFLEARCEAIDPESKKIRCSRAIRSKVSSSSDYHRFPEKQAEQRHVFELDYDMLVYAVGAETADFNIPGVRQHTFFFKELRDARNVRSRISDLFEEASLPSISEEDRKALLNFIVIGGGPTGVEIAADLADFVEEDCRRLYPKLCDQVSISLVNMEDHLLSTYSRDISIKSHVLSLEIFEQKGVEVLNGWRVTEVTADKVKMTDRHANLKELPHGCVIWAAGVKPNKLTGQVKASLCEVLKGRQDDKANYVQSRVRGLATDEWLHVWGSLGSIFALGDASSVQQDCACLYAEELFKEADVNNEGKLSVEALRDLLRANATRHPQFEAYADYLEEAVSDDLTDTFAEMTKMFGKKVWKEQVAWQRTYSLGQRVTERIKKRNAQEIEQDLDEAEVLQRDYITLEGFKDLLKIIHKTLETFPPTAQVAAQQGQYLAKVFASGLIHGDRESYRAFRDEHEPFTYFHKGTLAYLGSDHAAFDLPILGPVSGPLAGVAWKAYETSAQMSWKHLVGKHLNRLNAAGRDPSRV
ncbi:NDB1 [Symbiodinium sp. KB8]|nr:NDB1 [Symbiodinium sp. KB8]